MSDQALLPYIAAVHVGAFKSFREPVDVPLQKLTVLAGANSSGKSSLMQGLLLLKQSTDPTLDAGPLNLDGIHVSFQSPRDFIWREPGQKTPVRDFELGLKLADGSYAVSHFAFTGKIITLESTNYLYRVPLPKV